AERLGKELKKADKEVSVIDKKLSNPNFVEKAPAEVVDEQKERRAAYSATKEKLSAAISRLEA
ncbi:MAG: hypothetical protein AAFV54_16250, partial [Pseudomonadota bacterium]